MVKNRGITVRGIHMDRPEIRTVTSSSGEIATIISTVRRTCDMNWIEKGQKGLHSHILKKRITSANGCDLATNKGSMTNGRSFGRGFGKTN